MKDSRGRVIDRRTLLLGGLLSVAAMAAGRATTPGGPDTLERLLQQEMPCGQAAAELGRRYLDSRPSEASSRWLAGVLFGTSLDAPVDRTSLARAAARLRATRDLDFRSGDLLVFDGWVVARTEARLLALLALLPDA